MAATIPPWLWPTSMTGEPGGMFACCIASRTDCAAAVGLPATSARLAVRSRPLAPAEGFQVSVPGMATTYAGVPVPLSTRVIRTSPLLLGSLPTW